jgi:hypothetical protein
MKQALLALVIFISQISFSQQVEWTTHTYTKFQYESGGVKVFTYDVVPKKTIHCYNLMIPNVIEVSCKGEIDVVDSAKVVSELVSAVGYLYDSNETMRQKYNVLYSMLQLVQDGKVTDKQKWNDALAKFTKFSK